MGRAGPQGHTGRDTDVHKRGPRADGPAQLRGQEHRDHRHMQRPGDDPRLGRQNRRSSLQRHTYVLIFSFFFCLQF